MVAERFKAIRRVLGKSQKAFAAELGLSLSGLQGYEAGTFAPGCSVLEALCRIGIDINWLLVGEGVMWRPGCEPTDGILEPEPVRRREIRLRDLPAAKRQAPESVKQFALYEQDEVWKRLDFGTVALLASQGRQELAWYILTFLVSMYPRGVSVIEIMKALEGRELVFTHRDVAAQLAAMGMQGLVVEDTGRETVFYRASGHYARLLMSNVGDRSQALEMAVEALIRYVRPAAEIRPEDEKPPGRLMNIRLNLPEGKGIPFIRQLTDRLVQACVEAGKEDGPDAVVVVIGAAPATEST